MKKKNEKKKGRTLEDSDENWAMYLDEYRKGKPYKKKKRNFTFHF